MNKKDIIKAGEIAKQVRKYAKELIKPKMPLLEIAENIEAKIIELGGKPAFPTNLSINEITAHYTPSYNDETLATGLLKIDFGVHVNGWVADTAFSVDLENSEENKKLIQTAELALKNALEKFNKGVSLNEIGKTIQQTIEKNDLQPIINLSGHSMEEYDLHAGITVPNIATSTTQEISSGLYAIEPFATTKNASGKVKDSAPSGIYMLINTKNIRNPNARKILEFIADEYETLPFCERWIIKKFTSASRISLKQLEQNQNLHHFAQLIESTGQKVAQAEHTILIEEDKNKIVTSE